MRTKTLLLTAALGAAGVIGAYAQTSVNYVGYINGPIPKGYSFRASGFRVGPRDIATLMAAPPCDVRVIQLFDDGSAPHQDAWHADYLFWDNGGTTVSIKHGEAVVVQSTCAFNNTFVGT